MYSTADMPVAMTIGASDSGGGAGIQADLLAMAANGIFGTTAITCLTAQNPDGISRMTTMEAEFVREQIEQVSRYFKIAAIKTGMLCNAEIIATVADFLETHHDIPTVVDPVMIARDGGRLLNKSAVKAMQLQLLSRAALITPNLDEAAILLGQRPGTVDDMAIAADHLAGTIGVPVLLKGGHMEEGDEVVDILAIPDRDPATFSAHRIGKINTHGSGCTLSSAIAANLAKGWELTKAVGEALTYLRRGLRQPLYLNGIPFLQH